MNVHPVVVQIKEACKARRWSGARLAREAGMPENTVARLLKGYPTTVKTLDGVLTALGLYLVAVPYPDRVWPPPRANSKGVAS